MENLGVEQFAGGGWWVGGGGMVCVLFSLLQKINKLGN